MDPTISLLRDLVAIDSVNPALVPGARGEREIALRIAEEMRASGLTVEITEAVPGRPNVVGVLNGRTSGKAVMFCGHTDTVGVAGMRRPFEPEIRGGRLYGRGAQDMKGGVAAMLGAARQIAEGGGVDAGRLIVAAVVDEEHASAGADALVRTWRADAAVVTEPTDLDIAVAHKGFQWITVETRGRAAHGSRPLEGRDAILRMGRVLARLEELDRDLQRGSVHPLLGRASLHASLVHGGHELSSYPDRARLDYERRTLPGESPSSALTEARTILERLKQEDPEFEGDATFVFGRDAYEIRDGNAIPALLERAATTIGCAPRRVGMSFWTDAAILSAHGTPAVLFGPGGAGLHSTEEHVLVDDVCRCRDSLTVFARMFLAANS